MKKCLVGWAQLWWHDYLSLTKLCLRKRICRRRSIGLFCRLCSSHCYVGFVVSNGEKNVYICRGIGGRREGGGGLTRRMSRRFCCSHRFCMCSCKGRTRLVGIRRPYDRSWCGHSIGHRPLGVKD